MKRRIATVIAALSLSVAAMPAATAQPALSADVSAAAEGAVQGSAGVAFLIAFIGTNLSSLFLPICSMLNTTHC
ncbi:hypothetical protein B841_02260 [Corynebacterium maris DSM 45190]|uniref:Secreted protein n=1 Tax=Corynebacterium maris DSM 45190 TaxID=1224163 RepID=S5T080_9CORY|nr:hypothetical protein [Corynebacterium maris]AGS33935.1 hypothetical protein B841_02260 [Corynebacterium maris DSM 45190]